MDFIHNKTLLSVLVLLVAVGGMYFIALRGKSVKPEPVSCSMEAKLCPDGSYVGRSGPACEFAACPQPKVETNSQLKTFTDPTGISFSYPENLSTKYISPVDWPPKIQLVNEFFACSETIETGSTDETQMRTINDRKYCRTKVSEGAAGSNYVTYTYAFPNNDNTLVLTFTLQFISCDNYDAEVAVACRSERAAFDIDGIVDSIAQSVKF